jgi:drug/metabolite transporter (DMT)-like permease
VPADAFLLALAAAFVHAIWNLLTAGADESQIAVGVSLLIGTLVAAPLALAVGDVEAAALPYVVASNVLELGYLACLATAYQRGPMSVVYPVARGTAPVLVLIGSTLFLATTPTVEQVAGVLLVGAGVLLVRGRKATGKAADIGLALLTAVFIAGYTVVDKRGLEHADPLSYLELVLAPAALIYVALALLLRGGPAVRAELRPRTAFAGVGMFAAYGLALAALAKAPAPAVAAVRETSVVIAAGLAAVFLREPVGAARAGGAALVAAGIGAIALG